MASINGPWGLKCRPVVPIMDSPRNAGHRDSEKLIIAIDFGTTYTCVAYGLTSDPAVVQVIKEWPGRVQGRNDTLKIPSVIKYSGETDDDCEPKQFDWGYKVGAKETNVIRGIKLALDPPQRDFYRAPVGLDPEEDIVHHHEAIIRTEVDRLCKGTTDIIADYLRAVYVHALSKIREMEFTPIESLPKEFVLTVPAIWSDRAKNATLKAARDAHSDMSLIGPGDLVKEPEAAALYASQVFGKRGLKKGDAFVMCDAGGGTIDLVAYQVTSVTPRLNLKELAYASGAAIGSMMINNGFERYLNRILGDENMNTLKKGDGDNFESIMNDFEFKMKRNFSSAEEWDASDMNNTITFPGIYIDDITKDIVDNTLVVKGEVLEKIFNPLVTEAENLVQAQLDEVSAKLGNNKAVAVILVGGFGASPYLKRRIEKRVSPARVIQPTDAWSAVVQGAVLYKMPNAVRVKSIVAPKSLGVRARVPYISSEHPSEAKEHTVYDPYEDIDRVEKMTWYILKDTDMNRDRTITFPFYRDIAHDYDPNVLKFVDELEESEATVPPTFPWEGSGVSRNCTLTLDLSKVDSSQFIEKQSPTGTKYFRVNYNLVVSIQGALMTFQAECNGATCGSIEVEY